MQPTPRTARSRRTRILVATIISGAIGIGGVGAGSASADDGSALSTSRLAKPVVETMQTDVDVPVRLFRSGIRW